MKIYFFCLEFCAEYLAVMFCLTGMKQSDISWVVLPRKINTEAY